MQANVLTPPIFMEQDPQIPSRHDLLKVREGSISFLILSRASSIMGPQLEASIYFSQCSMAKNQAIHMIYWKPAFNKSISNLNISEKRVTS